MEQWRAKVCELVLGRYTTDVEQAFGSIDHKATDRALGAAGATDKTRASSA